MRVLTLPPSSGYLRICVGALYARSQHEITYLRVKLGLPVAKQAVIEAKKMLEAKQQPEKLWELKIKHSAIAAFHQLDSSGDGSVSIDELAQWLEGSWAQKQKVLPPSDTAFEGGLESTEPLVLDPSHTSGSTSSPPLSARAHQLSPIRQTLWRSPRTVRPPHMKPPPPPSSPPPRYCRRHSAWIEQELAHHKHAAAAQSVTAHRWLRPIPPRAIANHSQLVALLRTARTPARSGRPDWDELRVVG